MADHYEKNHGIDDLGESCEKCNQLVKKGGEAFHLKVCKGKNPAKRPPEKVGRRSKKPKLEIATSSLFDPSLLSNKQWATLSPDEIKKCSVSAMKAKIDSLHTEYKILKNDAVYDATDTKEDLYMIIFDCVTKLTK